MSQDKVLMGKFWEPHQDPHTDENLGFINKKVQLVSGEPFDDDIDGNLGGTYIGEGDPMGIPKIT